MNPLALRVLRLSLVVAVAVSTLGAAAPAHAATSKNPAEFIDGGFAVSATVTGPGITTPLKVSGADAGRFMSSWLAYSIYGKPFIQKPPTEAVQYRITIVQRWENRQQNLIVLYATLGPDAWITMPPPQDLGWASVDTPSWIKAQNLSVVAFKKAVGTLPPVPVSAAPTTAGAHTTSSKGSSSKSSAWIWIVVVVAVVGIGGGGLALRRRGRKEPAPVA